MTYRVQINQDTFIDVDGQWCIVQSGSVIDVPDKVKFGKNQATVLNEASDPLLNSKNTSVRNMRKK